MSTNLERITSHNERLETMKETVAALPEAGSDGAVETCTVRPYLTSSGMYAGSSGTYYATVFRDGTLTHISGAWNDTDITPSNPITDVVCGSVFILNARSNTVMGPYGGATLLSKINTYGSVYSMPTTAGADVQLFTSNEVV